MDEEALGLIAKKCMGEGGDVRKALRLVGGVVEARRACLGIHDNSKSSYPLITFKDAFAYIKAEKPNWADQISGFPEMVKSCLVALCALGKVQVTETKLGKLKNFVGRCINDIAEWDQLDLCDFINCLEMLQDSGLLHLNATKVSVMPPRDQVHVVLKLGYQLEEVQRAVDEACKGDHYQRIANWAEENKQDLMVKD